MFRMVLTASVLLTACGDGRDKHTTGNTASPLSPTLTWNGAAFFEDGSTNNGTMIGGVTVVVSDDYFVAPSTVLEEGVHYAVSGANLPAGLALEAAIGNTHDLTFQLLGQAQEHVVSDDVDGIVLSVLAPAFEGGMAPTDGTESHSLSISFANNPHLEISDAIVNESPANDGSTQEFSTVTVTGDAFTKSSGELAYGTDFLLRNGAPMGIWVRAEATTDTTLKLWFQDAAGAHRAVDSFDDVEVEFLTGLFQSGSAPTDGSDVQRIGINFVDQDPVIYAAWFHREGNLGNLLGADGSCYGYRPQLVRHYDFAAILSTDARSVASMATDLDIDPSLPIYSESGVQIAADWAGLLDGAIDASLFDAGVFVSPTDRYWTGSNAQGQPSAEHCNAWTSTSFADSGRVGLASESGAGWLDSGLASCGGTGAFILCVGFD